MCNGNKAEPASKLTSVNSLKTDNHDSKGKDTMCGYWEMMRILSLQPLPICPEDFFERILITSPLILT
ncbi:MAG: hypothetical protein IT451_03955 [Candidatus Brocadia sp.]|nr:hypothetical protein [Candidatus Brocadia sp.]